MVEWCHENNFQQSFIEVMPVGELITSRTNQFLNFICKIINKRKFLDLKVYLYQQMVPQNILKLNLEI